MAMRNIIRKITPKFIIEIFRGFKRYRKRNSLLKAEKEGTGLSQSELENQLRACGIQEGATLLVHASLSKIGPVQGGAHTVVSALLSVLGPKGNLLMPSSPVSGLQLEFESYFELNTTELENAGFEVISYLNGNKFDGVSSVKTIKFKNEELAFILEYIVNDESFVQKWEVS